MRSFFSFLFSFFFSSFAFDTLGSVLLAVLPCFFICNGVYYVY